MFYTVKDVAEMPKIPGSTVYEYVRNHIIPSFFSQKNPPNPVDNDGYMTYNNTCQATREAVNNNHITVCL